MRVKLIHIPIFLNWYLLLGDLIYKRRYLKKVIKENDFKNSSSFHFETNSEIIKNEVIRKRKAIFLSKDSKKIDFSQYDDLTIKEIKDKLKDEKTSYEEKMIYKQLLSYRTQRK